jgi:LDH2 family malate/lactate/ureidoglycolate dehydrogenase
LKAGEPVKAPGDVERAMRKQRLANGIPVDDTTRSDLMAAAQSVGIDEKRASAMIA